MSKIDDVQGVGVDEPLGYDPPEPPSVGGEGADEPFGGDYGIGDDDSPDAEDASVVAGGGDANKVEVPPTVGETYGLSPEEVKRFQEAGVLDQVLTAIDRRFAAAGRGPKGPEGEPPAAESKATEQKPPAAMLGGIRDFKFEFSDDEAPDGLRGSLERFREALVSELGPVLDYISQFQARQQTEEFDGVIRGWGDEWSSVFGSGRYDELQPDSDAYKARVRLGEAAAALAQGYAANGQSVPPLRELLERARRIEFGDHETRLVRRSVEAEAAQARKMVGSRATERERASGLTPAQRAARLVDRLKAERGLV